MREKQDPIAMAAAVRRFYPHMQEAIEFWLTRRASGAYDDKNKMEWPSWCFAPMAMWYSIVSGHLGVRELPIERAADVAHLAAIGTWQYTQGIYRFDEDIQQLLMDSPFPDIIPCEVLYRLPEWCIYIETTIFAHFMGAWVHLEYDFNTHTPEARVLLNAEDGTIGISVHLGDWPLQEGIRLMQQKAQQMAQHRGVSLKSSAPHDLADLVRPFLTFALYVCADNPEIWLRDHPSTRPGNPKPKINRLKQVEFPLARRTRIWTVGEETGAKIRAFRSQSPEDGVPGGHTVSSHIRRGHWHGYWSGPLTGPRRFDLKFLPPTFVAGSVPVRKRAVEAGGDS